MSKKLIYKPKGRSLEYAGEDAFALNIYNKCDYGCTYCYNKRKDENFFLGNALTPKERDTFLNKLKKELPDYAGKKIFLSFGSDPFPPIEAKYDLTYEVLKQFLHYGISPIILTKGMIPPKSRAMLGYFQYQKKNLSFEFGTTLVLRSDNQYEPFAASYENRFWQLDDIARNIKGHRDKIWVSLEPVIDPRETLEIIKDTHTFVDHYKIGTWNYDEKADLIDWQKFMDDLEKLKSEIPFNYMLKQDLKDKLK